MTQKKSSSCGMQGARQTPFYSPFKRGIRVAAGSIMLIEPKCFDSDYKSEPAGDISCEEIFIR